MNGIIVHTLICDLIVHVTVVEGRTLEAVGGSTGSLHSVGHSRWSTREDTNLGEENVLFLEVVKELVEIWTTEVGESTKTGKQVFA